MLCDILRCCVKKFCHSFLSKPDIFFSIEHLYVHRPIGRFIKCYLIVGKFVFFHNAFVLLVPQFVSLPSKVEWPTSPVRSKSPMATANPLAGWTSNGTRPSVRAAEAAVGESANTTRTTAAI